MFEAFWELFKTSSSRGVRWCWSTTADRSSSEVGCLVFLFQTLISTRLFCSIHFCSFRQKGCLSFSAPRPVSVVFLPVTLLITARLWSSVGEKSCHLRKSGYSNCFNTSLGLQGFGHAIIGSFSLAPVIVLPSFLPCYCSQSVTAPSICHDDKTVFTDKACGFVFLPSLQEAVFFRSGLLPFKILFAVSVNV